MSGEMITDTQEARPGVVRYEVTVELWAMLDRHDVRRRLEAAFFADDAKGVTPKRVVIALTALYPE